MLPRQNTRCALPNNVADLFLSSSANYRSRNKPASSLNFACDDFRCVHYTENYTRHKPAHLVFLENDISKCNHWRKSVAPKAAKQNCAGATDKIRRRNSRLIFFRNHDIHGKSNASCFICISIYS